MSEQLQVSTVHKTERSLPSSPLKRVEVIGTLAKKFNPRIAVPNKSGRKKNKLSEEEEEWIENLLERSDITYSTPGRRDTIYVGMDGGKKEYKQKRYLLWKLRYLLEINNGSKIITNENFPSFTEAFEHELSFRQMYNFLKTHKEVAYNSDIPQSSCLFKVCKNASLLAKGINSSLKSSDILSPTDHDLVETQT